MNRASWSEGRFYVRRAIVVCPVRRIEGPADMFAETEGIGLFAFEGVVSGTYR